MNIAESIKYLYPQAVEVVDWSVEAGTDGPFIRHWSPALGPIPSAGQLEAAYLPAAKALRIAAINAECRTRLITRYGQSEEQVSRSMGVYGATEQQGMQAGISATVDASNAASNVVLGSTTIAEVEAVTATWPAI